MTSYDETKEDYIVNGVPDFVPKDMLLKSIARAFKNESTIAEIRQIRRKLRLENGETISIAKGDYICIASNPPDNPPAVAHFGINNFRILRKNASYYCGNLDHIRKKCTQLQQRLLETQEKKKQMNENQEGEPKPKRAQKQAQVSLL